MSEQGLEELERGLRGGLRFANLLASFNQEDTRTLKALLNALVEILIGKGIIHLTEIDERRELLMRALAEKEEAGPRVQLVAGPDKYEVPGSGIDCSARTQLCRSACCTFRFPLSVQDLDEGVVKWDYLRPYAIACGPDGYCIHLDRRTLECTIYDQRPAVCRGYSCRDDRRVWENFETRTPNRELAAPKPATDGEGGPGTSR